MNTSNSVISMATSTFLAEKRGCSIEDMIGWSHSFAFESPFPVGHKISVIIEQDYYGEVSCKAVILDTEGKEVVHFKMAYRTHHDLCYVLWQALQEYEWTAWEDADIEKAWDAALRVPKDDWPYILEDFLFWRKGAFWGLIEEWFDKHYSLGLNGLINPLKKDEALYTFQIPRIWQARDFVTVVARTEEEAKRLAMTHYPTTIIYGAGNNEMRFDATIDSDVKILSLPHFGKEGKKENFFFTEDYLSNFTKDGTNIICTEFKTMKIAERVVRNNLPSNTRVKLVSLYEPPDKAVNTLNILVEYTGNVCEAEVCKALSTIDHYVDGKLLRFTAIRESESGNANSYLAQLIRGSINEGCDS